MSRVLPATPLKHAEPGMAARLSASTKLARQPGRSDPSPPSTYRDTPTASSLPATPFDTTGFDGASPKPYYVTPPSSNKANMGNDFMDGLIKCLTLPNQTHKDSFILSVAATADDPFTVVATPVKADGNSNIIADEITHDQPAPKSASASVEATGPTRETAQDIYPADACIFVANLNSNSTDAALALGVESAFQKFGSCFAKIRRDARGMPFAFLQFTNSDAAQEAVMHGKNQIIDGRKCRTEQARVRRTIFVLPAQGRKIEIPDVLYILQNFGPVESYFIPTQRDADHYDVQYGGAFFQMAKFKDCQQALANLRVHPIYVFALSNFPDAGLLVPNSVRQQRVLPSIVYPALPTDLAHLGLLPSPRGNPMATHRDDRTILLTNVPMETTSYDFLNIFTVYGKIQGVEISLSEPLVHEPIPGFDPTTYILPPMHATVEFEQPASAIAAVRGQNMQPIHGRRVRVQMKPHNVPLGGGGFDPVGLDTHTNHALVYDPGAPLRYTLNPPSIYNMMGYGVAIPILQRLAMTHARTEVNQSRTGTV